MTQLTGHERPTLSASPANTLPLHTPAHGAHSTAPVHYQSPQQLLNGLPAPAAHILNNSPSSPPQPLFTTNPRSSSPPLRRGTLLCIRGRRRPAQSQWADRLGGAGTGSAQLQLPIRAVRLAGHPPQAAGRPWQKVRSALRRPEHPVLPRAADRKVEGGQRVCVGVCTDRVSCMLRLQVAFALHGAAWHPTTPICS